jgi:hypothetical protein
LNCLIFDSKFINDGILTMNVNLKSIFNPSPYSEFVVYNSLGKLKGFTVRAIHLVHHYLQNKKIAGPSVIVFSVISLLVAAKINVIIFEYLMDKWKLEDNVLFFSIFMGGIVSTTTLLNIGFYKCIKPAFSPLLYSALSIATIASSTIYFVISKDSEE